MCLMADWKLQKKTSVTATTGTNRKGEKGKNEQANTKW